LLLITFGMTYVVRHFPSIIIIIIIISAVLYIVIIIIIIITASCLKWM
jgi:hypothetical protein